MQLATKIAALAACLVLGATVFELVRKKRIREEYSLVWFAVAIGFGGLVLLDRLTLRIINLMGGTNVSSLFFFAGTFFAVLMLVHLTVRISEIKRKQNVLIQESGLLREQLERLSRRIEQEAEVPSEREQ